MQEVPDLLGELSREFFETGVEHDLPLELDDGTQIDGFSIRYYVDENSFRELDKRFLSYAHGKVLDIGCGPGRVCVYLKEKGIEVEGVDLSDSQLAIASARGVKALKMDVSKELPNGPFGTVVMFGNNFGMLGDHKSTKDLLVRLKDITTPDAVIIAEGNDPDKQTDPSLVEYQHKNLEACKRKGQRVWRHISGRKASPFFPWINLTPKETSELARDAGWKMDKGPVYEETLEGSYYFTLVKA